MPTWTAIRSQLHHARAARAARRRLERELSCYTSPSDLDDLDAILDRYPERDTVGARRILAANRTL